MKLASSLLLMILTFVLLGCGGAKKSNMNKYTEDTTYFEDEEGHDAMCTCDECMEEEEDYIDNDTIDF